MHLLLTPFTVVQGGEFKDKALENWQFYTNGILYGKKMFPNVLEHSFIYLFCSNKILPKSSKHLTFASTK